jgi:tetratricopeptide (TPR) repeat protein
MKGYLMRLGLIIGVTALVLSCQTVRVGRLTQPEVQQAVIKSQTIAHKQGWPKAIEFLQETHQACGSGQSGRGCRSLINYSLGFMFERQSRTDADRREAHLTNAVESYRKVLVDSTQHGPTMHNLALIYHQLGNSNEALNLLHKAITSDSSRGYLYETAIGDIMFDQGQLNTALQAYRRAARMNPRAEKPPLGIINVYGELPADRRGQLTCLLEIWKDSHPDASEQGYRLIIKAALKDDDTKRAESAFLGWVTLLARGRRLTIERVNSLYSDWRHPAMEELLDYLGNGPGVYDSMNWWPRTNWRRHVLAEAALAAGHMDLKQKGASVCESRWQEAIREISPSVGYYFEKDLPMVRLDLQTELAALYYQYPDLDPDNRKFGSLIWRIFRGKGEAYEVNDLKAIQGHHAVLGFIYSREPERESTGQLATNAVFQLYHAIKTANKRFNNGEPYQPVPQLKEMLADACRNPSVAGKQWSSTYCTDHRGRELPGDLYLEAAKAYLDTDQLKKAINMLEKAKSTTTSSSGRKLYADLTQIVKTRSRIEKTTPANVEAMAVDLVDRQDTANWFTDDQFAQPHRDFVSRQRFKTISDLTLRLEDFAKDDASLSSSLRIIAPDLNTASKNLVLAGTADQLRVEKLASIGIRTTLAEDCPQNTEREDVRWVQRSLNKIMQTDLIVDGQYDNRTRKVVRDFQREFGLQVDGEAGSQTKGKIRELLCQ